MFLLDSGDTPPALLTQLKQDYPWIRVYPVPEEVNYYQAKMLGDEAATGEGIFCANWLGFVLPEADN